MSKPKRRTEVVTALRKNGCTSLRNVGGHEIWGCPCDKHIAPVPNHREITAGVIRSIRKQMDCLPEGWLK
jgi:predicted RNA binding protein YcfA (HicA-like mRNA interferase family)